MRSTENFIDQEVSMKFKPMTYVYQKKVLDFMTDFVNVKDTVPEDVKLRAMEEYEKIKKAMQIQNIFEK